MKNISIILGLLISFVLQSCHFGGGLIEEQLSENIYLIAINSLDEAEIIYSEKDNSIYYSLVPQKVVAVGYNDNFIIAKNYPIDSIISERYYIIDVEKISKDNHEEITGLTIEQFYAKRTELNVPKDLTFEINLEKAE